jgi:cytoskeletal protein CcmA (bactofilin family)
MSEYLASGSTSEYMPPRNQKRCQSMRSDEEINAQGPLEVTGSIESGRSVNLQGDISVRGSIDAYGNITAKGRINCQ